MSGNNHHVCTVNPLIEVGLFLIHVGLIWIHIGLFLFIKMYNDICHKYNDICLYVRHYIFVIVMGLYLISNPMYYESWMYTCMYLNTRMHINMHINKYKYMYINICV